MSGKSRLTRPGSRTPIMPIAAPAIIQPVSSAGNDQDTAQRRSRRQHDQEGQDGAFGVPGRPAIFGARKPNRPRHSTGAVVRMLAPTAVMPVSRITSGRIGPRLPQCWPEVERHRYKADRQQQGAYATRWNLSRYRRRRLLQGIDQKIVGQRKLYDRPPPTYSSGCNPLLWTGRASCQRRARALKVGNIKPQKSRYALSAGRLVAGSSVFHPELLRDAA